MTERWERTGEFRAPQQGEFFERRVGDGGPMKADGPEPLVDRWILRRIDEPDAEKPKEAVYQTIDECVAAMRNEFGWNEFHLGLIKKHIGRFRPESEDTKLLDAMQRYKIHIGGTYLNDETLFAYDRNSSGPLSRNEDVRSLIRAAVAAVEKKP